MSDIRIEGAVKQFGQVAALHNVNLHVQGGEFAVLLGPSGSGKTTLLRAIAGLEPLTGGRIWLGDRLVEDAAKGVCLPPEARDLGMVFQEYALWPHLNVFDNVALPLRERRISGWREQTRDALGSVGLGGHAERFPFELSGGQQQRVALARALAGRPRILLFDEPLSNLDAKLRDELRLEIAQLTRQYGTTAVYITHDQSEAFFLADRLGVMNSGRLEQFDRPELVYQAPSTRFVARFTGAAGQLRGQVEDRTLHLAGAELLLPTTPHVQGRAEVSLRPEAISFEAEAGLGTLGATVTHCAYSGAFFQVWLQLAGAAPSAQNLLAHSPHRLTPGQQVWITLDPYRLFLFSVEDQEGAASA